MLWQYASGVLNAISVPQSNSSPDLAQLLVPARLIALNAPDSIVQPPVIQALATRAGQGESVGLVIGHNRLALYAITRWARACHLDSAVVLSRIELSRAFTCFQLHRRILTLDDKTLSRWHALYVLGMLETFYDESVEYYRAAQLLKESLARLKQMAREGLPILITFSLPKQTGREGLVKLVASDVDEYWEYASDAPMARTVQMPLLGQSGEGR
jgi:hypothetical protein